MTRRPGRAALVACLAACVLGASAAPAAAHSGDPNMRSAVRSFTPATEGVDVTVLNGDDRLLLANGSGRDILVEGYSGEPYARVGADGTVEVNTRSPAYYLNQERDGKVDVPAGIDSKTPPRWKEVSQTGRFEWHDHRMHWMGAGRPPQVEDESVRTKVFDYSIPVAVDGREGAIAGTLTWVPTPGGGLPLPAIMAFAALVIGLCVVVVVVRRRRTSGDEAGDAGRPAAEAW